MQFSVFNDINEMENKVCPYLSVMHSCEFTIAWLCRIHTSRSFSA